MPRKQSKCYVELAHEPNPDLDYGYWDAPVDPGDPKWVAVKDLDEASSVARRYITRNQLGGGNWAGGRVKCGGKIVARVAYNGRIRPPKE